MLFLDCLLLVAAMYWSRKERGPVWAFCISWLICVLPVATGVITYMGADAQSAVYTAELAGYMLCFLAGVALHREYAKPITYNSTAERNMLFLADFRRTLPIARLCWVGALVATAAILVDYFLLSGVGLDDLAALRDVVTDRDEATIYAKISAVLTWGSIYCYCFAILNRRRLRWISFIVFLSPVSGYFLVAVLSAGRQASLQIVIFTILTLVISSARDQRDADVPKKMRKSNQGKGPVIAATTMTALMFMYMGYVAVARNDEALSFDKSEVLESLFEFEISPNVDGLLRQLGDSARGSVVEGLVYFSNSTAFFSAFLKADWPNRTYGVMSFPFVFRQIQGFTGVNVRDALEEKIKRMNDTGVLGVGWTTAISSHVMDYGLTGAGIFLFIQGFFASWAWRRAIIGTDFHEAMIGIVLAMVCVYTPLLPALSDTNIFIFFSVCVMVRLSRGVLKMPISPPTDLISLPAIDR